MVDVGAKHQTHRIAVASGHILMRPETLDRIRGERHAKGNVLGIARVAGIMAAKRTADLIPLCHPVPLSHVEIELHADSDLGAVTCRATTETVGRTGVEMGGADGSPGNPAHHLRHVQGRRPRHGHCAGPAGGEVGCKSGTWTRPGGVE